MPLRVTRKWCPAEEGVWKHRTTRLGRLSALDGTTQKCRAMLPDGSVEQLHSYALLRKAHFGKDSMSGWIQVS